MSFDSPQKLERRFSTRRFSNPIYTEGGGRGGREEEGRGGRGEFVDPSRVSVLERQLRLQEEASKDMRRYVEQMEADLAEARSRERKIKEENTLMQKEVAEANIRVSSLIIEKEKLESSLQELENKNKDLLGPDVLQKYKEKIRKYQEHLHEAEERGVHMEDKNRETKEENDRLKREIQDKNIEIQQLIDDNTGDKNQDSNFQKSIDDLQYQNSTLKETIQSLNLQLTEQSGALTREELEREEERGLLKAQEKELKVCKEELKIVTEKMEEGERRKEQLEEEVESLRKKKDNLSRTVDTAKSQENGGIPEEEMRKAEETVTEDKKGLQPGWNPFHTVFPTNQSSDEKPVPPAASPPKTPRLQILPSKHHEKRGRREKRRERNVERMDRLDSVGSIVSDLSDSMYDFLGGLTCGKLRAQDQDSENHNKKHANHTQHQQSEPSASSRKDQKEEEPLSRGIKNVFQLLKPMLGSPHPNQDEGSCAPAPAHRRRAKKKEQSEPSFVPFGARQDSERHSEYVHSPSNQT